MEHLIMRLESPLIAFGGETIDNYGVIRPFPAASMLTGLLANAMGWRRIDRKEHQELQDRLVFASRIDREAHGQGLRMTDFQTAQLSRDDKGWTTRGMPEGRAGGPDTYNAPHLRYRDYYPDMLVMVALRLSLEDEDLNLTKLKNALREPARPLFIGRKPCLPSCRILGREPREEGATALEALLQRALVESDRRSAPKPAKVRAQWPQGEGVADIEPDRHYMITDQRNWESGLHGGGRGVCEGSVARERFKVADGNVAGEGDRT